MKKRISQIIVFLIITSLVFIFTGCSNKSVEKSKEIVAEYFDEYEDNDADDIIDLMHDDLIDTFESKEDLEIVLLSRIAIFGEIEDYKLVGTSYYKNNGVITVSLDYEVTYKRTGETLIETFEFLNDGEDMKIDDIINENDTIYQEVPDAFFKAYENNDDEEIINLFAPSTFNYFTEEELLSSLGSLEEYLGSYIDFEQIEEWYYYSEVEEDNSIVIYEGIYILSYESGSIKLTMQLCVEDDEIKIYDIIWSEE